MSSESAGPNPPAKTLQPTVVSGPIGHVHPAVVPVFNCIVYVAKVAEGVRARVANLAGLETIALSERAALGVIIPAFKQQVAELVKSGTPIPWIDPPQSMQPDEQPRFIPVHL